VTGLTIHLRSGRRAGYALMLTAALLYAAGGNAVKALFRLGEQPIVMAQLRIGFAFVWLFLALALMRPALLRVPRSELPGLAVFGIVAVAGVQATYYIAIARINIGIATFVEFSALIGVAAWERIRRGQPVAGRVWLSLALVLTGAFFMVGAYRPALFRLNLAGIGLSLLAAVFFAAFLLRTSTLVRRIPPTTVLLYGFGFGTAGWVIYDLLLRPPLPSRPLVWSAMALIGLLGTLAPFTLEAIALRFLRPSVVGIIQTAEPLFAGLIAFAVFGDLLEPPQVIGALVVAAGIILVQARAED
jgi:drug/metabolite transporter (DMT)-like permease